MTVAAKARQSIRFRSRSFHAMVLAPELPLVTWLNELDAWLIRSPGFFLGRPVVLDASALGSNKTEVLNLIDDLQRREIKVLGIESTDPAWRDMGMPALVRRGRQDSEVDVFDLQPEANAEPLPGQPKSLLLDSPVRSGQSISHLDGDVTVMGSVASGAEIIAGGSIHIYGALRGRAIAGATGAPARIFCRKLEAELLAIDGLYMIAEDMNAALRGRPVQVQLNGDSLLLTALD